LRHVGDAAARPLEWRQRAEILAVPAQRATAYRMLTDDAPQQAGLADPVAPEHAGHPARLGRQADAPQRLGGAIVQVDPFRFEHRFHRPRYTSITRSSALTWSSEPSARTEPSCRTVTRTPRSRTKVMSCSTTTTEWVSAIRRSRAAVSAVSASVIPAAGSSISS